MRKKIFLKIFFILNFIISSHAIAYEDLKSDLGKYCDEYLDSRFVSCTYLFTQGHKVIKQGAKGHFSIESQEPLKPDQLMPIASATKTMTAAVILKLQARGKLNVKDTVAKHLGKKSNIWKNNKIPEWAYKVKIHHLLTHTSGIPEYFMQVEIDPNKKLHQIVGDIARFAAEKELMFEPGTEHYYCNTNFTLLGLIIEKITKKDLASVYKKELFDPLGMKNTKLISLNEAIEDQSDSLIVQKHPVRYFATPTGFKPYITTAKSKVKFLMIPFADGGVLSNTQDLVKWHRSLHTGKVLPKKLYNLMITKHNEVPAQVVGKKHYTGYGIFMIEMDNGDVIYHHSGRAIAIRSESGYVPARDIYFAVLSNVMEYIPPQLSTLFNLERPCNQLDIKYFLKYVIENLYNH